MEKNKDSDARTLFILAMSHWQLGEHALARKHYDKALEWLETNAATLAKNKILAEELRRFRAEAEEHLELKKK